MNPSFHDTNKLFKALKTRIVESMRNDGDSLYKVFSKDQQDFQDMFEELEKKRLDSADQLETIEASLRDSHEKAELLKNILQLDSQKLESLKQATEVDQIQDSESSSLLKFQLETQSQFSFSHDLLKLFVHCSGLRIEPKESRTRFVFRNVKQNQPKREFWVDVLCDQNCLKMGEVSDYFFGRDQLAMLIEKFHDLPGFLKTIRKKFKEI